MENQDVLILGYFYCYAFDKMFPFLDFKRYPVKSGSWTDGYAGVLLKGVTKEDIKNITEHIISNGYIKEEIKVFKIESVEF